TVVVVIHPAWAVKSDIVASDFVVNRSVGDGRESAVAVIVVDHVMSDFGIARRDDEVEVTIVVVVAPTRTVLIAGNFGDVSRRNARECAVTVIVIKVVDTGAIPRAHEQVQISVVIIISPRTIPVIVLICDNDAGSDLGEGGVNG